jgi:hypothetical protein
MDLAPAPDPALFVSELDAKKNLGFFAYYLWK